MADFQNVVRTDFFHGLFLLFRRRSSFFVRACRPLSCWSDFDSLSQRCSSVRNCIEQAAGVTVLGQIPEINISDETHTPWRLTEGGSVLYNEKEKLAESGQ